jgi:hypothetical protein
LFHTAISNSRSKYKIWRDNGKPSEVENVHFQEKKKAKRHLRKTIRIEQAIQKNKEKELIMETKTKDMKLFHILVPNNRKKGGFNIFLYHVVVWQVNLALQAECC